jgi:cyclopropane fatty-acyl-phospholipid synthase-like methyltransferase
VTGKSVLELGSGEGHLTASTFSTAKRVKGIDISPVAVTRAEALSLPNASFETSDFLSADFSGYDVIAAIECLYYLSAAEQKAFFDKLVREHRGGIFIMSAPIIGSNEYRTYYTHRNINETFHQHGLTTIEWRNLNAYRRAGVGATLAAAAVRLPFGDFVVRSLPERWVYQRCYVARCP